MMFLEKYIEVFVAGGGGQCAQVEPIAVVFKDGWRTRSPPMEDFRSYAPRVEAAIEANLKNQLEMGVGRAVEPSDADFGCAVVRAVPKPDSESSVRVIII
jgi:hypothetical protein